VNDVTYSRNYVKIPAIERLTFGLFKVRNHFISTNLKNKKIMSSGKVLLGVLAGVAAGALLGVLFAPDKGWNTRKRILKKGDEYADALTEKFNDFLDSISEKIDEVEEEVSDFAEQSTTKSAGAKKDAKTATG
jgi:gas vesicle protein